MRNTRTLEEAELTQNTQKQESPEPEEAQPDTQEPAPTTQEEAPEQETTALVPTEPDVIEGEVIVIEPPEPSVDHIPPKQKPYWLLIPLTILACLAFVAVSSLVPLLTPSATVTIIPVERGITTTATIQVQARLLPALTLSQGITVPATGIMHQDATRASGTITFYNGLLTPQTIAAGTRITGSDGVQIVTDHPATIPAATPPIEGHRTVSAHAIATGASGNIPANDIHQACCAMAVLAKNTTAFTGGQNARAYRVVTTSDVAGAQAAIHATLTKSVPAALTTQLHPGEALLTLPCTPTVASDHKPGEEARHVTVTVSVTCGGIVYAARDVDHDATLRITTDAAKRFGTGYSPLGDIQTTILQATATTNRQGTTQVMVRVSGTWVYQVTPGIRQQLLTRIAGRTIQQAAALLLSQPGIAGVQISANGGNRSLPQDPNAIRILVQYTAGHNQR